MNDQHTPLGDMTYEELAENLMAQLEDDAE
jgi:hypothetical protein